MLLSYLLNVFWRCTFLRLFKERLLLGHFKRVILPQAHTRLETLFGKHVDIDLHAEDIVNSCEDRKRRLLVTRVITTDVGKRRSIRRAEELSRKLLRDAKHTIDSLKVLPEKGNESHPLYLHLP